MNAKLFVSYSRKDSTAVRKLVESFREMDYDVWVDLEDIHPATNWMEEIEAGIERSDTFAFLISPDWKPEKFLHFFHSASKLTRIGMVFA